MTFKGAFLFCIFLLITVTFASAQPGTGTPTRNDHIFPSAIAAKPFINYDARGFLINGKRTFITSASMEYARVPRGLWRDRLLRLKRAGFNTIEMYTFWNFHEPNEGKFNFAGDHDLNAYLQLIKSMGMYAIVRVGPYVCGEWSMGGYPIWLKFKPGLRVREDNPQFLSAVDHFFDKLIPIVTKNQINHGGAVIMVQLENEHRAGWGTIIPNNYFKQLQNKTVGLGLQVPYYFSGLHSGNDPSGDFTSLDDPARPNPWFCPEYWGVWFLNYGPQELDSTLYDRRTWKMLAHGANGYNVYMAHGGSNFEYFNDKDNAASYDYGAAVGQAGDLRPIYYAFKRANWFAQSFQSVLENSLDEQNNKPLVSDTNIRVTVRKSPTGSISFLDNADSIAHKFKFTLPANVPVRTSTEIKLAAGEIMPLVQDYQLTPQVKLVWAPTKIYSIIPQGKTTTLVVYGVAGTTAQLYFNIKGDAKAAPANFKLVDGLLNFHTDITSSAVAYSFADVKIIVVNDELATRTWFAEANGQNHIIIGPDYAADLISKDNKLSLVTEEPWFTHNTYPTWIFKPVGSVMQPAAPVKMIKRMVEVNPGPWQAKEAAWPLHPRVNYIESLVTDDPQQMGADGDVSAYAWYSHAFQVKETGSYIVHFTNVSDRAALFLNEKRIDTGEVFNKDQPLYLKKGINALVLYTAHNGRNKLIFKIGRIDTLDVKGLSGPVTLQKANGKGPVIHLKGWGLKGGIIDPHPLTGWKSPPVKTARVPYLYRATLNLPLSKQSYAIWRVNTTSLSYGSVWVNGHNLGRYPEKIKINGMYIPECWLKPGANTIVIYDENGVSPKDVRIEAEQVASRDVQTLDF
ncbi:beta-galactosidase [Mucilaginibacter sp. UYCu711]|uniref:beta-galactosidase n=1 Tax=Mucilaginibacter sp. UYCu711 TaxID=3156339 RepID=UPI003D23CE20